MRKRSWDSLFEDDPAAGLLNLFDVWIVFSVALLLALFTFMKHASHEEGAASSAAETPKDQLKKAFTKAPHFRPTQSPMTGDGTRLGVAYRLQSGEVVYVPDVTEK